MDATGRLCVCEDNAIVDGRRCRPCPADEVAISGVCGCAAGTAKNNDNVCVTVAGLGDSCSNAPCGDASYPVCAPESAGKTAETCTKACASDADCGASYTCATWEPEPYCREFGGNGKPCTTSADCAGTDATFCDTYFTHSCIVAGCSLDAGGCPRGNVCCDFSGFGFGNLCAPRCTL